MKKVYLFVLQIIILFGINTKNVYAVITLNRTEVNIGVNSSVRLTVNGDISSGVSWNSSNPNVATISNGYVTGRSPGIAYITVNSGSYTASCKVNVILGYVSVNSISLAESSGTVGVNQTKKINATINPANATKKVLNYVSSDNSVAVVSSSGVITGKKAGVANITVTADDKSAVYKITVISDVPLKGISVSPNEIEIVENGTGKLNVTYNPANTTSRGVSFKSSNTGVVTVDSVGNLKAVAPGTATISVTSNSGGFVATSKVIVNAIDKTLKGISLNKKELTLEVGKSEDLIVSFNPNNAENKEVTWSSSNRLVVSVEAGKVTALKPGTVEIKATSDEGNFEAVCTVKVPSPPIESFAFANEEQAVFVGDIITLETVTTPDGAIIEDGTWTSSNEEIATVEDGVVTALMVGTTEITVKSKDEKITASTIVNVVERLEDKLVISIEGYDLNFDPDVKKYDLQIGAETSLNITVNRDSSKVAIGGNRDLKNGSIITITVIDNEKDTYVINIKKKQSYVIPFIAIITVLLIVNIIRVLVKNKKNKRN